jgi:hypothetical protein
VRMIAPLDQGANGYKARRPCKLCQLPQ